MTPGSGVSSLPADARPLQLQPTPVIIDPRDPLTDRSRERGRTAMPAERIGVPDLGASFVADEVRIDIDDAVRAVEYRAGIVECDAGDRAVARRSCACTIATDLIPCRRDFVA